MGARTRRASRDRPQPAGGRRPAADQHRPGAARRQPHPHRSALRPTGRGTRPAGSAGLDRRPGHAGRAAAQAQEPVAALGADVHPLAIRNRRHDRPAPSAQSRRRAGGHRSAAHRPGRALRPHQRRQPAPRPRRAAIAPHRTRGKLVLEGV
ncbi:hypothetical protein [Xanthomonas oryzae pv. oryzae MAFF 311018]|nr:hypothetical protein [Xanthomonas oryzae pv. oryzae MAFF 311018]